MEKIPDHGGNLYNAARKTGRSVEDWLDFSANINPLGLAGCISQVLVQSIPRIIHYPDPDAFELKRILSRRYGVEEACITAGNGAVELLYILCHVLKPRRVLIPAPSFGEYERAARAAGAEINYILLKDADGFLLTAASVIEKLPGTDMVFIGNPNNPTGTILTNRVLEEIIEAAGKTGTVVVLDESFIDFLPDDAPFTCRSLLSRYPNLVILHSLTKFYAIPGLRLGFSLTSPDLAQKLHAAKDPWNVNSLAQAAGIAALEDEEYGRRSRSLVQQANKSMYEGLQKIAGFKPFPPAVNYILVHTGNRRTAVEMQQSLLAYGILIRDCSNYPGLSPAYIRVAVKRPAQNQVLLDTLQNIAGEEK
ncbi:aminotransferases class-i pyridoxal-phosphate attachment site [Lucifera butyrica]|uniref:threonine-phosphate decarboxylase n=1 Tax=Lucifera butyrica TaxID=1351585 RepID=A0A498R7F0_9FIRM|nr:threonine-phosphate decarboxylase CobD [Lucifera butyrica]VBB06827.1 aminotransferases class-i pyridoxal-phosphate attachment site [Lucifera butyrica]